LMHPQTEEIGKMRKEDVKTEQDVIRYLEEWSEFERAVYVATYRVPYGRVTTYQRIAGVIGRPRATRAVANTLHNNPLYPTVPCWRVVRSDGGFGGEEKAASGRREHVKSEGVQVRNGKVVLEVDVLF
jgi:methylated-DNA-[protein]-cysteine S-methyltransferase